MLIHFQYIKKNGIDSPVYRYFINNMFKLIIIYQITLVFFMNIKNTAKYTKLL